MKLTKKELKRHPWLVDAVELGADSFPFHEHNMDNSWLNSNDIIELPEGWIVLGFCDGDTLRVRPRPGVAVKFADKTGEFWMHVICRWKSS